MKTFTKHYIGKGKKVNDLDIIKVSFNMEAIAALTHEYKGETYLSFEVAKMKSSDQFENTHTVYVNVLEKETVAAPASTVSEPTAKKKSSHKKQDFTRENSVYGPVPADEIPF
jgi:hypothetical protein